VTEWAHGLAAVLTRKDIFSAVGHSSAVPRVGLLLHRPVAV